MKTYQEFRSRLLELPILDPLTANIFLIQESPYAIILSQDCDPTGVSHRLWFGLDGKLVSFEEVLENSSPNIQETLIFNLDLFK